MKTIKKFFSMLFVLSTIQINTSMDYSCTAELPESIYAAPGETVIIRAPDCFVFTGFGSTIGPSQPIEILFDEKEVKNVALKPGKEINFVEDLKYYPKQGDMFVFRYTPFTGQLRIPIEVVVRSEPISQEFQKTLEDQLKEAQKKNEAENAKEIASILANIDNNSSIRFYRRLPSIGEKLFKPLYTKIFDQPPEQVKAGLRIRPNGNLQVVEDLPVEDKIVEIKFGSLRG